MKIRKKHSIKAWENKCQIYLTSRSEVAGALQKLFNLKTKVVAKIWFVNTDMVRYENVDADITPFFNRAMKEKINKIRKGVNK